jgi:hypothetical protein
MRLRSAVFLVFVLLVAGNAAEIAPADKAADDLEAGRKQKAAEVSAAADAITDLEAARKEASKKQRFGEFKRLSLELKKEREHLRALEDTPVEDFAKRIAAKRETEEAAQRTAEQQAADRREAQLRLDQKEAERLRLTGGCPLEITGMNFFHSQGKVSRAFGRVGPSTMAVFTIVNRSTQPVDANEVLIQFYDGFDALIAEHTLQGALLKPGEESKVTNGLPEAETAITMKIFVQKAKLPDGRIWERLPEHKATGRLLKIPEGAKVLE